MVDLPLWKIWHSSVGMIIPNIWKNKTCSKPPARSWKSTALPPCHLGSHQPSPQPGTEPTVIPQPLVFSRAIDLPCFAGCWNPSCCWNTCLTKNTGSPVLYTLFLNCFNWLQLNLVGGWPTPLKKHDLKVTWDDYSFPTEWKFIKFHGSKPPCPVIYLCNIPSGGN